MLTHCNICAWHANNEGVHALTKILAPKEEFKIPAGIKRRASSLTKLVIASCLPAISTVDVNFIVFATQHGEINRTLSLLLSLADGTELSPTAFAQSVSSTAPGLLTIAAKKPISYTTVSAGENTLEAGLMEVSVRLKSSPKANVLFILADEDLPEIYRSYHSAQHQQNILAVLFQPGAEWTLNCETKPQEKAGSSYIHDKEALINGIRSQMSFPLELRSSSWSWTKSPI